MGRNFGIVGDLYKVIPEIIAEWDNAEALYDATTKQLVYVNIPQKDLEFPGLFACKDFIFYIQTAPCMVKC